MSCSSHDVVKLELGGTPAVFVAADTFARAAETQAALLPLDPHRVFLPGPIASRSRGEIEAMAEQAVDAVVAALTAADPSKRAP